MWLPRLIGMLYLSTRYFFFLSFLSNMALSHFNHLTKIRIRALKSVRFRPETLTDASLFQATCVYFLQCKEAFSNFRVMSARHFTLIAEHPLNYLCTSSVFTRGLNKAFCSNKCWQALMKFGICGCRLCRVDFKKTALVTCRKSHSKLP